MSDLWVNVAVVLFFILMGGFFAAAELALVSLRESQVQRLSQGSRRGARLSRLAGNPNRYLAAVQVGVTLAGFISAGFGASQIAPVVSPVLVGWGLSEGLADTLAFIAVTVVIAYLSLVLGELVPKRIALQRVEKVALLAAAPIDILASVFKPFIVALSASTNAIVRLLGGDPQAGKEQITGEELRDLVAAHGELTIEEREMIDDVFSAGDRELREVMLPRTEVDFLEAGMPVFKAAKVVVAQPHSRYPVIRDSADDVIGFVHVRDILDPDVAANSVEAPMLACIRPPGSQDSHRLMAPYIRSAKPARSRISPSMMNSGMATSRNSVLVPQAISPMARLSGSIEYSGSSSSPSTPSDAATGMLSAIRASSKIRATAIMRLLPSPGASPWPLLPRLLHSPT